MGLSGLVAMSGGVDSSAAAVLALRGGLDCAGAVMRLHPNCADGEAAARAVAVRLGMPFYSFDFSDCFEAQVISRFIAAYREGRTPNPCVECNRRFKFGMLLDKARELGMDHIVTGHYARAERSGSGRFLLKKGADLSKDQSYVLYSLTQDQLSSAVFPLGEMSKPQVRELALSAGLDNAGSRESQDICFIPGGDYAKFIALHTGSSPPKGPLLDVEGNCLGEHDGIIRYTVGQRRGMGLAMPYPAYVLELRCEDNAVVVGKDEMLYSKTLHASDINLIPLDKLDAPLRARVRIRYRHAEQPATVWQTGDDALRIEFDEPQRAITKGQAAVIYDDENIIGGGTIEAVGG